MNTFTITIKDNKTGETIVNYDNAICILGAINNGKSTHSIGFTRCNAFNLAQTVGGVQNVLAEMVNDHPEIEYAAKMIALMEEMNEEMEAGGKEEDDEE